MLEVLFDSLLSDSVQLPNVLSSQRGSQLWNLGVQNPTYVITDHNSTIVEELDGKIQCRSLTKSKMFMLSNFVVLVLSYIASLFVSTF